MATLSNNIYKQDFVTTFPGDDSGKKSPRYTPNVLYSKAFPTPVQNPKLLAWSNELASQLGIEKPVNDQDLNILAGNHLATTMYPYAACYGGHQFGNWAGQLGDGRAITLGEWQSPDGKPWELQLKGAGITPYSRQADGRAVLRSSVREYLMSEAMFYLGVPTTRALSLVSTGEEVIRDMFYNGNAAYEPGAIVMRVAPSFLRFGNFEILASRGETENLRKLTEWTISRFYPHIQGEGDEKILAWFKEVVDRTAQLMVEWLRVGFVHGVMNTDNMSILGLTIDYGPYSFLDDFDLNFTPNTTDLPGRRYAFGKQASIAYWNLGSLASAIAHLFEETEKLGTVLYSFEDSFWTKYYNMLSNKLGLDKIYSEDIKFFQEFEKVLAVIKPDMTIFYQLLMEVPGELISEQQLLTHFDSSFYKPLSNEDNVNLYNIINKYLTRLSQNTCSREESLNKMRNSNPRFILRNYLLHEAIQQLEKGDNTLFSKLEQAIKDPYSTKFDEFFQKRPEWATQKAGCSMLSCSS